MGVKKLSDVAVGQKIKIGGNTYKVVEFDSSPILNKEVVPGIFSDVDVYFADLVSEYRGMANHLVSVVEDNSGSKSNLTSQLQKQIAKKSLTDDLRCQVKGDEVEKPCVSGVLDGGIGYGYSPSLPFLPLTAATIEPLKIPEVEEAKKSALTANLRSQSAEEKAGRALVAAANAKLSASGLRIKYEELGEDIEDIKETAEREAYRTHEVYEYAQAVSDVAHNALFKVEKIEQKQKQEEIKMDLQNQLNQKLGLQAKFNSALQNNKTTGGNGMKNILGAFKGLFGKVEGKFAFSLATQGLAIRKGLTNDFVAFNKDNGEITDVTGLTLDFKVPAFKLPVVAADVQKGDIVLNGADFGYVTKVNDGYVETIVPEKNVRGNVIPTKNVLFGQSFYTVVKTMDAAGQGGFNPMMLLAMGDGNKDELVKIMALTGGLGGGATAGAIDPMMLMLLGDNMDELLPFFLMQQGGVADKGAFNPLMLLALGDKKGGKTDKLLPLLMMQGQAGGQAGGINPMMLLAMGDGELDLTTLALMGGLGGGQGLFGQAPVAKEVKKTDK